MTPSVGDAGPSHLAPEPGDDDAHLRALVESERVVGSKEETDEALDVLAALLLDLAQDQGGLPTHAAPTIRPDARDARGPDPPQLGAVGT